MFSWSNNATTTTSRRNQYPGRRTSQSTTANAIAGSIRPPSSRQYSRAEHLKSYLEDATLQRSTRQVSAGTYISTKLFYESRAIRGSRKQDFLANSPIHLSLTLFVSSLVSFLSACLVILADDTTYDTVFQTTDGATLILRVNIPLSSSFASSCPAMSLAGVRVRHAWLEGHSRVTGYAPIRSDASWKDSGLLLGAAVHAVVEHFQLNPPQILEITDSGLRSIQTNPKYKNLGPKKSSLSPKRQRSPNNRNQRHSHNDAPPSYDEQFSNLPPPPEIFMPSIPTVFTDTETMERQQLEKLLDDELEFLALVHTLDTYANIQDIQSDKAEESVKFAKENLEQEETLKAARAEVESLQQTLKEKVAVFSKLEAKQNAICAPPDKRTAIRSLQKAARQAMDESEDFADEWVNNGGSPDDFVKEFVKQRMVHHQREAKVELLKQQNVTEI